MPEESDAAKPQKTYVVHTTGGASLTIPAFDYVITQAENRIYFLDAEDNPIEKWVVFWISL